MFQKKNPSVTIYYALRGKTEVELNWYDGAVQDFAKAFELKSKNSSDQSKWVIANILTNFGYQHVKKLSSQVF